MVQHRKSKPIIRVGESSELFFCGYLLAKFKPPATTIPVEPCFSFSGFDSGVFRHSFIGLSIAVLRTSRD